MYSLISARMIVLGRDKMGNEASQLEEEVIVLDSMQLIIISYHDFIPNTRMR